MSRLSGSNKLNGSSTEAEDADRRSVSFFGIHKVADDVAESQQHNLRECYVLLPREGIVNVPYLPPPTPDPSNCLATTTVVASIRGQLELQSGYTLASCQLLLRGQDLEVTAETDTELMAAAETLQLSVLPQFQELLNCVEAANEDSNQEDIARAWMTAAAAAARRPRTGRPAAAAASQAELVTGAHSALVLACCRGRLSLTRLILRIMPALANAITASTGRTALHFACYHERPRICRLLLSRMSGAGGGGAGADRRDRDGNRPLDYASGSADSACRRAVLGETSRATTAAATSAAATRRWRPEEEPPSPGLTMRLFQLPLPGQRPGP